jgi:hypothetical protein
VTRIELALSAWEADVLPLNYTRELAKMLHAAFGGVVLREVDRVLRSDRRTPLGLDPAQIMGAARGSAGSHSAVPCRRNRVTKARPTMISSAATAIRFATSVPVLPSALMIVGMTVLVGVAIVKR